MRHPYIGITDFENASQINEMLQVFSDARIEFQDIVERRLMIGFMISYKTLMGIPSKWDSIWVPKEKIKTLCIEHPLAYNTVHYADYTNSTKAEHLLQTIAYCGENLHAIQFDMIWPSVEMVSAVKEKYPYIDTILQINTPALSQVGNNPTMLTKRLESYSGTLDFILLDKSMGMGKGMNAEELLPFIEVIASSSLPIDIAVAGGLGPKSLHLVLPLINKFPFLSIDAQGQLRPSGNPMDPIDWKIAAEYIRDAIRMYAMIKKR